MLMWFGLSLEFNSDHGTGTRDTLHVFIKHAMILVFNCEHASVT